MDNANAYQTKNEIQRQVNQRHAQMDKNLQKQMVLQTSRRNLEEKTL